MSMIPKALELGRKPQSKSDEALHDEYRKILLMSPRDALSKFHSHKGGLDPDSRSHKLAKYGPNLAAIEKHYHWYHFLLLSFKDPFILVLIVLAAINFALGDQLGSLIIILIACASALIRFKQDFSTYRFNQKLKEKIAPTTDIIENGEAREIRQSRVVPGDIVALSAGSIVPADCMLIESKDLFVNMSVFTGESIPVEKKLGYVEDNELAQIPNLLLMGASIVSGNGKALVINTGRTTYLGRMGSEINNDAGPTNFDIGMAKITRLLIRYMVISCPIVFAINCFVSKDIMQALLFSLSIAVGITPSMLPMIVNVNLAKGTKDLAKHKALVKTISSIQNLGAIDVLCTDKTGTLTEGKIVLQKYINMNGEEDDSIIEYAYLNSLYGTGVKNMLDKAIIQYGDEHKIADSIEKYNKVDEIPFDYIRKKQTIVVKSDTSNRFRLVTKGALEEVLKCCTHVKLHGETLPLTDEALKKINAQARALEGSGMQIIALASRHTDDQDTFKAEDENNLSFVGFVAFLDPIKADAKATIQKLNDKGVDVKILTGDNAYTATRVCAQVGIKSRKTLTGDEISAMSDRELSEALKDINVFARVNPLEKERIVSLLRKNGHVVGYMGDGVNDAPSLHSADVGISVDTATDIAKETSDIILLQQSLDVVHDGIVEGRIVYGNIVKYMKMALSDDFGDVFSIIVASIFLPFLPLLPIQMLIQDFLYDFSQIAIPYDNVDPEFLKKPKKWDTKGISRFMNIMGVTSSVIDIISFVVFWYVFKWNTVQQQSYFQTAWFIECLINETIIIFFIRTSKKPFIESRPSLFLFIMSMLTVAGTIAAPILLHNLPSFHYEIMPPTYYLYLVVLFIAYAILVSIIKKIYIRHYKHWL